MFKHSYKKPIYNFKPSSLYDFYCIDPNNYEEQFRVNNPYSFNNFYSMEPNDYENQLGVNNSNPNPNPNPNPNNYHYANRGFEPYKHNFNLWNYHHHYPLAHDNQYVKEYNRLHQYRMRNSYKPEWGFFKEPYPSAAANWESPKENYPMSGPSDNTQSGKRSRKSHKYRPRPPPSYHFSPYNYAAG